MTGPRIDSYAWPGGREAVLRFGPEDGPVLIAALPLFEEANRTRAFTVAILRALADRGIAGMLPELPGTGESLIETQHARLADMRQAFTAAAATVPRAFSLAIRSGALLDTGAALAGRWHLSPQDGPALLREVGRIVPLPPSPTEPVEAAGNLLAPDLLAELAAASPVSGSDVRTARLASDPRPADLILEGAPLWRRAEPGNDPLLAQKVADDIARWIAACAA